MTCGTRSPKRNRSSELLDRRPVLENLVLEITGTAVRRDLAKQRIAVRKTAFRAPNTNAYVERFIQTIQHECLDHFVILGQRHFDYLVAQWLDHYHRERP